MKYCDQEGLKTKDLWLSQLAFVVEHQARAHCPGSWGLKEKRSLLLAAGALAGLAAVLILVDFIRARDRGSS